MDTKPYEILSWDTDFFGCKVAKVNLNNLDYQSLTDVIKELKNDGVQWVYGFGNNECAFAQELGGLLVDEKTTYLTNTLKLSTQLLPYANVIPYPHSTPTPELYELALESGKYSRFLIDPKSGFENFKRLYYKWMENCVNKQIALETFIYQVDNKIVGFIAVGEKNKRGDLIIAAIDPKLQGKGIGTQLYHTGCQFLLNKGFSTIQAVIQSQNIPIIKLYSKIGLEKIEKIEYVYHFWL